MNENRQSVMIGQQVNEHDQTARANDIKKDVSGAANTASGTSFHRPKLIIEI